MIYDSSLFMTLNKVKETIISDSNKEVPLPYEREFDLVVKIEEIDQEYASPWSNLDVPLVDAGSEKIICLKVTDTSNMMYDIITPQNLLPTGTQAGAVVRITKLIKSKEG